MQEGLEECETDIDRTAETEKAEELLATKTSPFHKVILRSTMHDEAGD